MRDGSKDDESSKRVVYTQKTSFEDFFCSFERKAKKHEWSRSSHKQKVITHISDVCMYILWQSRVRHNDEYM